MIRKSRIYSISIGTFIFLLGLFMLVGLPAGLFGQGAEGVLITFGVLFFLCGAFGLAGGLLLHTRLKLARVLLLVAALLGIPLGLVFFFVFMYARKGTLRLRDDDAFRPTNIGASPR